MKKIIKGVVCAAGVAIIALSVAACAGSQLNVVTSENLMDGITPSSVTGRVADTDFADAYADFSIELFKRSLSDEESALVSPLSVMLALAMTANGANGTTLTQMQDVLGGGVDISLLNEYLYSFTRSLANEEKSALLAANSVWIRDSFAQSVKRDFLQTNADYYGAAVYKAAFDDTTVRDINSWVSNNTENLIKEIIQEIGDVVMYLINTVFFEAAWAAPYTSYNVRSGSFSSHSDGAQTAQFMSRGEYTYLSGEREVGFIKPYHNGHYSFAALLPSEGTDILEYAGSLSGSYFNSLIAGQTTAGVWTSLPKFSYGYSVKLNGPLARMGMPHAFSEFSANFSNISSTPLFISEVLHKTYIEVDENGTKAAAVTSVAESPTSAPEWTYTIALDRPFVYAIIDNASRLPIFLGTVLSV